MDNLIERIASYCKMMSGQEMPLKALDKQKQGLLPLVITGTYICYDAILLGVPIILLVIRGNDYTPKQLQKHQQMVTRLTGCHSVFAMENVASYHISRMVNARVNFIIPNKLIYVPALLINLKEVKDGRKLEDEMMPGTAQCVLLYHLQKGNLNGWTTRQLAKKFKTSYASMNRALRWLKVKGFVGLEGIKEKALVISCKRNVLWEQTLPLMVSPVERLMYTDAELMNKPFAGESALERLTMIAAPQRPCKAVSKNWAQEQKGILNNYDGDCVVEVWRYEPSILEKNNMVDPLSLYLSLQTSDDERIRIELKKMINNITWLED